MTCRVRERVTPQRLRVVPLVLWLIHALTVAAAGQAQHPKPDQNDLSTIADAYKGKRDEARATANFSNSAGVSSSG